MKDETILRTDFSEINIKKVITRFNELVNSVRMDEEPFTTALYGNRLASFCTGEIVYKNIYGKNNNDRRITRGKITAEELVENSKQYIIRYNTINQPINEVKDDIKNLKVSKKSEEDYSLYETIIALTVAALDRINVKNKITIENYLLKSLATSKKVLDSRSKNSEYTAEIKKSYIKNRFLRG